LLYQGRNIETNSPIETSAASLCSGSIACQALMSLLIVVYLGGGSWGGGSLARV
jgi:hypothetical protein